MGSLADVYVRIRGDTGALKEDTRKGAESAGKEAGSAFHASFTGMIKQAAAYAGTILSGAAIWNIGKIGLQAAADMQQAQIAFTTLIGDGQKAQAFLSQLKDFAEKTPFELPGLIDDSRLLLGVGVAANSVIPTLTAWGNAAGALGISNDRFNHALLAVSQSMAAGKINAQDMNQIIQAGIPIWKIMAEATGKTVPELRKLSEQGKLLSSDILPKVQAQMQKDYGGAMIAQSRSLAGVWSTLVDSFRIGLADAITPLIPTMSNLLPRATNVLSGALAAGSKAMQEFTVAFGAGWHDSAAGAHNDMALLGSIAHEVFNWLRTDGVSAVKELWAGLREGIAIVADIVRWFNDHRAAAIALVAVYATLVAITRAHALALEIEAAGSFVQWILKITNLTKVAAAVQWLWNIAMDANPIGLIIIAVAALAVGIAYLWTHSDGFRKFFIGLWADIWSFLKVIGSWFAGPFVDFFVGAASAIAYPFVWVWDNAIKPLWEGLKIAGAWIAGPFASFWVGAASAIAAPFLWLWHNVMVPAFEGIRFAIGLADRVITSAINLWVFLFRESLMPVVLWIWHNVFEPVFHGIAAAAVWLYDVILKPTFDGIVAAGKAVGDFFVWLWHNAVEPAAKGIATAALWVWNVVLVPAFHGIVSAGHAVGDFFVWLWRSGIEPAIHGIASLISWWWNSVTLPTFNAVMGVVRTMRDVFREVFGAIGGFISGAFSGAASVVRGAMNAVIGVINSAIGGINDIISTANKVPGVDFPHIPTIPRLATGGLITKGGRVLLGEVGAEVVDLPAGAAVYPNGTVPADNNSEVMALLQAILEAILGVAPGVGEAVNGAGTQLRRLARAGA